MKTIRIFALLLLAVVTLQGQNSREGKTFTFTNNTTLAATDLHLVLTKGANPINLVKDPVTGVNKVGGVYENYPTGGKTNQDYKTSAPVAVGASVSIQFDDNTSVKEWWWTQNDVIIDVKDDKTDGKMPGNRADITVVSADPPDRNTDRALVCTATGTGKTSGHIATLSIYNPTNTAVTTDAMACYIPSKGEYQPYVIPYLPPVTVPPHGTVNIPVEGYCADIHTPPVPSGDPMPPFDQWVRVPEGATWNPDISKGWAPAPASDVQVLQPATGAPLGYTIDIHKYPQEAAPALLDALVRITKAYDSLHGNGAIATPFSGNPEKEREAVIQQTFWLYTATLTGDSYKVEDFHKNTISQFENGSGTRFRQAPPAVRENVEQGVSDFWGTFQAVGVEAKVLAHKD